MNNTIYLYERTKPEDVAGDLLDFATIGEDILDSEELTNKVYESYLGMIVKRWTSSTLAYNKRDFHISDIGIAYNVGPYIPCVKRVSYTKRIDIEIDGMPGIRVVANTLPGDSLTIGVVRPFKLPRHVALVGRAIKTYKYVTLFKQEEDDEDMDAMVFYFGVSRSGEIVSTMNKQFNTGVPWVLHGASQLYPALAINAWADARYLWQAVTKENIGSPFSNPIRLRLGLNKEHIKSLFYARSLPVTETGRKRPILHWVRAHQRRIKEGLDIDISAYLRGIVAFEMDGLSFEITQPNKEALHKAEPETVNEAFRLYA